MSVSSPSPNPERIGEGFIIGESILWSWFPILTLLALQSLSSLVAYTWTLLFAGLFFLLLLGVTNTFKSLLNPHARRDMLLGAVLINGVFLLIYGGLLFTSAVNMALIMFTEVLFSFLLFNLLGKEPLPAHHALGALIMSGGALVILLPGELRFNQGDWLILGAACIAPLANRYQKRARAHVPALTILASRTLFALPILGGLMLLSGASFQLPKGEVLGWLVLNGVLIFGVSKLFWIEGIHRISVTKATAMHAMVPMLTMFWAYWVLAEIPNLWQIIGAFGVIGGGILITRPPRA